MTPKIPDVLYDTAAQLIRWADPMANPVDRGAALGLSSALLGMAAGAFDAMADTLAWENAAFRGLLGRTDTDANLRISTLQTANADLRAAVIALQADLEGQGDTARLDAIWAVLLEGTERRKMAGSPV